MKPSDQGPDSTAVKYHATIPFDLIRRSMFIPDELLDAELDKQSFIAEKVRQLTSLMLSSDVAARITVVEQPGTKVVDGTKTIKGRYIELRLPVGKLPDILNSSLQPHGAVAAGLIIPPATN